MTWTQLAIFDGPEKGEPESVRRLSRQIERVYAVMKSGQWWTLEQIAHETGDPQASVSAQLRHLRKPRFGGHTVRRHHIGHGLYAYRLDPSEHGLLDGTELEPPRPPCPHCGGTGRKT